MGSHQFRGNRPDFGGKKPSAEGKWECCHRCIFNWGQYCVNGQTLSSFNQSGPPAESGDITCMLVGGVGGIS